MKRHYRRIRQKSVLFFSTFVLITPFLLSEKRVRTGADRLFESPYYEWIRGKRLGLITNSSGVNSRLEPTRDLLARDDGVRLQALFAPEHGVFGAAQAGEKITSRENIYSLHGKTRAPTPEMLENIDVLIYDIQDVGTRFYTYISTLYLSMKAAARQEISFIVLDRPNPLNGVRVQGPVLEPEFQSFVGIYPLPIRYGMTIGELAQMLNAEDQLNCDLRVVPLQGWNREDWFDETGLHWVPPSPNMPTLDTGTVYPGLCLIEGTNLSEGRGTTRPFELIGSPWLQATELVTRLNQSGLGGVRFRSQIFTPTFSKYQDKTCYGLQIHVTDRNRFDPVTTGLHVLAEVLRLQPDRFRFNDEVFDRLAGNNWIRKSLLEGVRVETIRSRWQPDLEHFNEKRHKYLIYR